MTTEPGHDPYFQDRLERAKKHQVIKQIELTGKQKNPESKKELKNPEIVGTYKKFGWSERAVNNILDAAKRGWIKIHRIDDERVRIEFLPILDLQEQLGHVTELENVKKNLSQRDVFGSPDDTSFTYLQTVDFAVEGYMDDEEVGKFYGRVYIDSRKLSESRNVYLDPESLAVTDYEYPFAFCVYGGVPFAAIDHIDMIRAQKTEEEFKVDDSDWPSQEDAEAETSRQIQRLKDFVDGLD